MRPLEVYWIPKEFIVDHAKMVVCVCDKNGYFFTINSKQYPRPSIKLIRTPDHEFLNHDSFLFCGDPLEIDEYLIDGASNSGAIGRLSHETAKSLIDVIPNFDFLSEETRKDIIDFLLQY